MSIDRSVKVHIGFILYPFPFSNSCSLWWSLGISRLRGGDLAIKLASRGAQRAQPPIATLHNLVLNTGTLLSTQLRCCSTNLHFRKVAKNLCGINSVGLFPTPHSCGICSNVIIFWANIEVKLTFA